MAWSTHAAMAWFVSLARRTPAMAGDTVVLRYPRALRVVVWCGGTLFLVVALGLVLGLACGSVDPRLGPMAWVAVPFGVLGLVGVLELRFELRADGQGVRGRTGLRGPRAILWGDVDQVRWSHRNQWFVLVARDGTRFRCSRLLQGHDALAALVTTHLPESVWREAIAAWRRDAA